jgi:hypothetical protein
MRNARCMLGLAVAAASMAAAAADNWTYTHYTASGRPLGTGVLELVEADGKATVSMFNYHEYADACYAKRTMNATVTRDAEFTVITTQDMVRGCAPLRITIRNDGAGGKQESQVSGEWVPDNRDHGLKKK